MEVLEVRWARIGTEPAGKYTFLYCKGNDKHKLDTRFFVHRRIMSAVKKVDSVSDT
jgi:hypothetical protein